MIEVERIRDGDPMQFQVAIKDRNGKSLHRVTMAAQTFERLSAGQHDPEACIEAAFRFLLDREPKESILPSFDVTVIGRYFPEFERELPVYLRQSLESDG